MTDRTGALTPVTIMLGEECLRAIDEWIARSRDPGQTRPEAIAHLLEKALGSDAPSTVLPHLVTGRDIV